MARWSWDVAAAGLGAAGSIAITVLAHSPAAPVPAGVYADGCPQLSAPGSTRSAGETTPPHNNNPLRRSTPSVTPPDSSAAERARACALGRADEGCAFLEPSEMELAEMARCVVVRSDYPSAVTTPYGSTAVDERWPEALQLTTGERNAIEEASATFREALWVDLVAMATEAGLDPDWAAQTDLLSVVGRIQEQDLEADMEAFGRIADERAGLEIAEHEPGLHDRLAHRFAYLGDDFEDVLADRIGRDRAHELRIAGDGWPGQRFRLHKRCHGEGG